MALLLLVWLALAPAFGAPGMGVPRRGPGLELVQTPVYLAQLKALSS